MIVSRVGRSRAGLAALALGVALSAWPTSSGAQITPRTIYAGETPLASTCAVTLVAPLTLRVTPCAFTTTGQARVQRFNPKEHQALLEQGKAERLAADPSKVRVWLQRRDGTTDTSQTYQLAASIDVVVMPNALEATQHRILLTTHRARQLAVVAQSTRPGQDYPALPAKHRLVHILTFHFTVPAAAADLAAVAIPVFTVLSGFPPGTTAEDWRTQTEDKR
mgnify:CR=1 FL=1